MKKEPQHLMAFNQPDVSSQSKVDSNYAAQIYMEQIWPRHAKGAKLGSLAIARKLDWMSTSLNIVHMNGGRTLRDVDFVCLHT